MLDTHQGHCIAGHARHEQTVHDALRVAHRLFTALTACGRMVTLVRGPRLGRVFLDTLTKRPSTLTT